MCVYEQLVRLNAAGQLGVGERCVDADSQGVKLIYCRMGTVDGPWEYDEVAMPILFPIHRHPSRRTNTLLSRLSMFDELTTFLDGLHLLVLVYNCIFVSASRSITNVLFHDWYLIP